MTPNGWRQDAERSIAAAFEEAALAYAERVAVESETETLTYDALNRAANRLAHTILAQRGQAGGSSSDFRTPSPLALRERPPSATPKDFGRDGEAAAPPPFTHFATLSGTAHPFQEHGAGERGRGTSASSRDRSTGSTPAATAGHVAPAVEPVAFLMEQGADPLIALLGILKAGKIYVALDPAQPPSRLQTICDDAQPVLLITNTNSLVLAQQLAREQCAIVNLDALSADLPAFNPALAIAPGQAAAITFTSGSTGQPKGVVYSQRALLYRSLRIAENTRITDIDRQAVYQSWGASWSLVIMLSTLLRGAVLYPINVQAMGLARLAEWLIGHAITIFPLTPTLLRQLMAALPAAYEQRFPALRLLWTGGEGLHPGDVAQWKRHFAPGSMLANSLSLTEAGLIAFLVFDRQSQPPAEGEVLLYTPSDHELLIFRDDGRRAAPGESGEIVVRSHYLMSGYWHKPQLTGAGLRPDPEGSDKPVYFTGDLGRLRADGLLEVLGRRDYQVKVRGFLVQPAEIEQVLLDLDEIRQAVVVAHDDQAGGKRLAAYLVAREQRPSVARVRAALARVLPEYMIPAAFIYIDKLPLTPIGKIDRGALPLPSANRPPLDEVYVQPRNQVEERLAAAWAEILHISPVGARDNFFELGGDSLQGARVVAEIERLFGARMAPAVLLEATTIEHLAALIEPAGRPKRQAAIVMLRAAAREQPALFCMPWSNDGVYALAALAARLKLAMPVLALLSTHTGEPNPFNRLEDEAAHYVRELCAAQPVGPYYLLGWSYGAFAAFETAQQLHAQGRSVAFLGILDSGFPLKHPRARLAYGRRRARYIIGLGPRAQLSRMTARARKLASGGAIRTTMGSPSATRPADAMESGEAPYFPPGLSTATTHPLGPEFHKNRQRVAAYTPRTYTGPISLFRTPELNPHRCRDPLYNWGYIAAGSLEVTDVPGDHASMLQEPHVDVLAEKVTQCVRRSIGS